MPREITPQSLHCFLAATLDVDRLKIISILSQGPASILDLAEKVDRNQAVVLRHLGLLEGANLVRTVDQEGGKIYQFDPKNLELMARQKLSEPHNQVDLSSFALSENQQVIVKNYTRSDGSLKIIPSQSKKIIAILEYVSQAFEYDKFYSEKEVNAILSDYHPDTTTLRRYLVDYGYIGRESNGMHYWREENRKMHRRNR